MTVDLPPDLEAKRKILMDLLLQQRSLKCQECGYDIIDRCYEKQLDGPCIVIDICTHCGAKYIDGKREIPKKSFLNRIREWFV